MCPGASCGGGGLLLGVGLGLELAEGLTVGLGVTVGLVLGLPLELGAAVGLVLALASGLGPVPREGLAVGSPGVRIGLELDLEECWR